MRVLHVIDGLGGSGGAENRMCEEVLELAGQTDPPQQMVVRLYERDFLQPRLEEAGVAVVALGLAGARGARNWPLAAWRLVQITRRFRPDVIHTSLFSANLAGQLAGIATRTPVVSTMTLTGDMRLHRMLQPGAASWRAGLLRWIAARVAKMAPVEYRAITHDVKDTSCVAMPFPPDRVFVIPRGLAPTRGTAPSDRSRFGLPDGVPLFVNVGRLTKQKGQTLLIEAFSRIRQDIPDAILAIAGERSDATHDVERAVTSHQLNGAVHLLGFRSDLDQLLASADIFLFSSLAEGLGTAVLEAVVAGLPVVTFDIPPVTEVVDGAPGVTIVPMEDAAALAAAAVNAWRTLQAGERTGDGRAWVYDRYELGVVGSRLRRELERVAGSA